MIIGRGGFTDSTKATTDNLERRVSNYVCKNELNDVHGKGLRRIGWKQVSTALRAMVAPKKKKAFKLKLEASRRLSKTLKDQLAAQKGSIRLVEDQSIATQCKAASKIIADAMDFLQ